MKVGPYVLVPHVYDIYNSITRVPDRYTSTAEVFQVEVGGITGVCLFFNLYLVYVYSGVYISTTCINTYIHRSVLRYIVCTRR